jgi:hypothetical protein
MDEGRGECWAQQAQAVYDAGASAQCGCSCACKRRLCTMCTAGTLKHCQLSNPINRGKTVSRDF